MAPWLTLFMWLLFLSRFDRSVRTAMQVTPPFTSQRVRSDRDFYIIQGAAWALSYRHPLPYFITLPD